MKLFKNLNEEKKVLELKIVKNLKTKFCSVIRSAAAGARGDQHGGNHLDKQGKRQSKEIRRLREICQMLTIINIVIINHLADFRIHGGNHLDKQGREK